MKISLIITTYNWPSALNAVLQSVAMQNFLPHEVIIADDGSGDETRLLINSWQSKLTIPLIHSWQEDDGFRLAESRNKAIAKASGDYIVMIDGDMFLSPNFIYDYSKSAKEGWFIQGGRVITKPEQGKKIINSAAKPSSFSSGLKNRKNSISCSLLSKIFSYERANDKSTRGCNMGFWRKDIIEVNGFNNDFVGWGREDSEFTIRMLNAGKRRLYLKFAAVAFHIFHNENPRASLKENDLILEDTINNKKSWCINGINQYL